MARKMVTRADHSLTFTFGDFQLDCRARELRKRGRKLRVQQQPIQILARLVAAAGDVVPREELRGTVWARDFTRAGEVLTSPSARSARERLARSLACSLEIRRQMSCALTETERGSKHRRDCRYEHGIPD
jgi:DNA-binding response OmpR family regulator